MPDVVMSQTSQHDPLTAALARYLCRLDEHAGPCGDHQTLARAAIVFLADHGAILPAGISISGVDHDGRRAWRIQADGVDVTTACQATNPREDNP